MAVKIFISSSLGFDRFKVSFPPSAGLKKDLFLSKFLFKIWGIVIWLSLGGSNLVSILSSWEDIVSRIWLVKLFCCCKLLQSFNWAVLVSTSFEPIVLKGEAITYVFWIFIEISASGENGMKILSYLMFSNFAYFETC